MEESEPTPEELESFRGYVHKIDGNEAYFTLTNATGKQLTGDYTAEGFASFGIHEGDHFSIKTIASPGEQTRFEFQLIPPKEITDEELKIIREKIDRAIGDYTTDDDY